MPKLPKLTENNRTEALESIMSPRGCWQYDPVRKVWTSYPYGSAATDWEFCPS